MKKIILVCASGMSTSLLMNKMRKAAKERDLDILVEAYPVAEVEQFAEEADVILLGPQIRHKIEDVRSEVNCPVASIDLQVYGRMDGQRVIQQVMEILNLKSNE